VSLHLPTNITRHLSKHMWNSRSIVPEKTTQKLSSRDASPTIQMMIEDADTQTQTILFLVLEIRYHGRVVYFSKVSNPCVGASSRPSFSSLPTLTILTRLQQVFQVSLH